jgi:predicted site-specific integrase-resolvase
MASISLAARASLVSAGKVAELCGVSTQAVRDWANSGLISSYRTAGKHRRFNLNEIQSVITGKPVVESTRKVLTYCRVSTRTQAKANTEGKSDLTRQAQRLRKYAKEHYPDDEVVEYVETGSAMNFTRKKLGQMLESILAGKYDNSVLLVEFRDRVARFGIELEAVSKPSHDDHEAGELDESVKEIGVIFIARDKPAEVLKPADRAFDLPAAAIAPELAAVLSGRPRAVLAVRTDEFDTAARQPRSKLIVVGRQVVEEPARLLRKQATLQERLDQRRLVGTGAGDFGSQGKAATIGEDHRFGSLPAFGLADAQPPFFAEENVPSAIPSSHWMRPSRSRERSSLAQAFVQTPASVQSWKRRQQVGGDGKCAGRSFHRAPLRSTHKMPSTHSRAARRGRPPCADGAGSGNKSAINFHCSSVSCGSGSFLDPAQAVACSLRDRIDISNLLGRSLIRSSEPHGLAIT